MKRDELQDEASARGSCDPSSHAHMRPRAVLVRSSSTRCAMGIYTSRTIAQVTNCTRRPAYNLTLSLFFALGVPTGSVFNASLFRRGFCIMRATVSSAATLSGPETLPPHSSGRRNSSRDWRMASSAPRSFPTMPSPKGLERRDGREPTRGPHRERERPRALLRPSPPAWRGPRSHRRCFDSTNPSDRGPSRHAFRRQFHHGQSRGRHLGGLSVPTLRRCLRPRSASSWGSMPRLTNPPRVPMIHHRGRSSLQIRLDSTWNSTSSNSSTIRP